jgi:HSP20 family molecular chaperone IbpA
MTNQPENVNQPKEIETRSKEAVPREQTRPGAVFRPDVDIVERGDDYLVTADLPGADDQHVSIRLEKGVLAIDADLAVLPDPGWTALYREYLPGGYHREFALSDAIDAEKIQASMRNGVLELRLPKAERSRSRTIEVRSA